MKSFSNQILSMVGACVATFVLTVAASAPAVSAAGLLAGAAA